MRPFQRNHERLLVMDVRSAELTKYAANAMLATRISFMNELANLSERLGADIELVRKGIGSDPRIGFDFLYPGAGYGGSCFPKDVQALIRTANGAGHELKVLQAVEEANDAQKSVLTQKIVKRLGDDLAGKTIALWGLAFKPNTDDMREAPSRVLIAELLARGARVRAYDPVASRGAAHFCRRNAHRVCRQADGGRAGRRRAGDRHRVERVPRPDFPAIKALLKTPAIFDGRNLYDPAVRRARRHRVLRHRQAVKMLTSARHLQGTRILVVGDVMLDRYWFGEVSRISPEAPVPVVKVERSEERPGGAANVARNCAALGARRSRCCRWSAPTRPGAALARLLGRGHRDQPARGRQAVDHRQAARRRPPAAAAAHRFRERAGARGAARQAGRFRAPAGRLRRGDPVRLRQGRAGAHRK
jgi:hypothetical protein